MASDKVVCKQGCGKTFKEDGAWRANHEIKCKGKVQTRGRIDRLTARRNGTPAAASAPKSKNTSARVVGPQPSATTVTPSVMLAALRAEAAKIQNAIAAIEALG